MPTNGPLITCDDVVEAMHANWSHLQHDREYTLKYLVGKELWLATHKGHRTQLGHEFKALVLGGAQPVVWVRCGSDNNQIYKLK